MLLSEYVSATRRLLHDANGRFWSTAELTDYINEGRRRVALDTKCLRSLEEVTYTNGDETFQLNTFTTLADRAIDVVNLVVFWGNQRIPLIWAPWTQFNAQYRIWSTNQNRPCVWSQYGGSPANLKLYIQPVPNQDYDGEADIFYSPVTLVSDATAEELVFPYDTPVPFYAAYLAKHQEQAYGEAEVFLAEYAKKAMQAINSFTRRLPNAYT